MQLEVITLTCCYRGIFIGFDTNDAIWSVACNITTVAEAKKTLQRSKMRKQKGFSLIELLIVVAIILIIAAIAIPNLLRARMSANESSAAAGVRTIATAQVTYNTTYQNGYADTLVKLGTPAAGCTTPDASTGACLIDNVLTAATTTTTPKSGYVFGVSFGSSADKNTFVAGAFPAKFNSTGLRSFCTTEDNVVHQNSASQTAIPSATDCISATWPALNN